ncbi:Bug family tripartite tricarboxylate transporter substrate binding protein [Actinomycetota bacterium Odt1-20B]
MRPRTLLALLGAALLVLVAPPLLTTGSGADTGTQIPGLRLMVPNTPGGGYDITARTAAKNAEDAGLTHNIEVFNLPGAGGTVGLTRLVGEHGNGKLAMSMGLGVVGAARSNHAPKTLADTTPIARLTEEPDVVVVAKDSPYKNIRQLVDAWKERPGKLPVGGGSSPGGPDHLAPMLMARAAGIEPKKVNYVPFDGGGELLASILGNKVAFGVSGVGEYLDQIKAGELRLLAVTGPKRVKGLDGPTLKESGYDVDFTNWRGIVAPPGLSDTQRTKLAGLVRKLHASKEWRASLKKNGWQDAYLSGAEFGDFLDAQDRRVVSVLKELGL